MSQLPNRFCGSCGTEVSSVSRFCSACGIELATLESVTTGETSDPADTSTLAPTPSVETPTPNPTTSTHSSRWAFLRRIPRWAFLRRIPRWPFSRRITTLLVLLIVSAAVIGLAISFWHQSSITFATNFNIGGRDTADRFSQPLAGGLVFNKNVDRLKLIKRLHHHGLPIRRHIDSKRDRYAVAQVDRLSKHQWWPSRHQHRHFQHSQSGLVVPHR